MCDARRLLRRNLERHGSEAPARARADRERARSLRQGPKSFALPTEHIDPTDTPIGIRVQPDLRLAGAAGRGAVGNIDDAGGAANAKRRCRRRDRHVAGLCHEARNESDRAARNVELALCPFLVDEFVANDARIRTEAERRFIVERHTERSVGAGLQNVIFINGVANLQRRRRCLGARHRRAALQCSDLAERIVGDLASDLAGA